MVNFLWAISASIAVSLISLVGVVSLAFKPKQLDRILLLLVGFGAGGLIGGGFLHLLPEALDKTKNYHSVFMIVILGFILFFILEKFLFWRHCHDGKCNVHVFTYLNIIGDAIHNFIDGLIMGGSFFIDIHVGMMTTLAIILHEIPQEFGDFGVLVYGGFSPKKALYFNFLSAITAIAGTVIGYLFSTHISGFSAFLLPFAAGGFFYIAACDLIPQLHKEPNRKIATASMICFVLGVLLMFLFTKIHH